MTSKRGDEKVSNVKSYLKGDLKNLPQQKSKVVSIFLSSTFTDMKNERDCIYKYAVPHLTKYCREKYNLEFQVIVWFLFLFYEFLFKHFSIFLFKSKRLST